MGRRSRKRAETPASPVADAPAPPPPPRPAPAAPRRRARSEERPPAPWGDFPLGELTTFAGIVLLVVGFATTTFQIMAVGFALVALSAVELTFREHFAGFRSHSSLLALVAGVVTAVILIALGAPRVVQVVVAAGVLAAAFAGLRRAFRRRSGGLGFRA
jgi:hypothetical protein